MNAVPHGAELERFRAAIGERLGLWIDDAKLPELSVLLARRAGELRMRPSEYVALIEDDARGKGERRALAQSLTVSETYFFRQGDQIRELMEQLAGRARPVRLLSAGCASGEEPYSIALALREHAPQLAATATIRAVDIHPAVIERAKAGRYSSWALRETLEPMVRRWFRQDGNQFVLDPEIRKAVQFEERNLIEHNADLFAAGSYEAVFFRNVLMYFTAEAAAAVIARIARALVPGGLLFLGYAETLRGLSTDFHLRHKRETFYYQKRGDGSERGSSTGPRGQAQASTTPAPQADASWQEAIERASARIRDLTTAPASTTDERASTRASDGAAPVEPFDLHPALELLRNERFGDALAAMAALPAAAERDPDVLLLRSALLVHSGDFAGARETCAALLADNELNAGAHYLLALVCEAERQLERAAEHHRVAAYLDPTFAMPRLHLGLIARRTGDALAAQRELRQACALLEREDTGRLLMFAGGFGRAALLALCKAELSASGGSP